MVDDIAWQLLGGEQRSSWCGERDVTGRFVCRRIRDHALDWHGAQNDAGGIHQWKAASTGDPGDHADYPVGTILVDPPTGRWAIRFTPGDNTGRGQHVWLAPAGVADCTRILHHVEVRGWEVADARRWGRLADDKPPVDGDLRARCITALSEQVSEFISPNEFGGYDPHYGELVDIVLDVVQPELDHLGTYKETAPVLAAMVDNLRAELRRRNRAYGRASETIGHLRAEQAHYREKLRIAHEAVERATRHRAAAQGIVMYVVDTLGLPINTVGDAAAIGHALRELKSELARQRESRLAWAIEADRLDVHVEELTRERDEAQQSLEAAHRELADYQQQYADLWRDATAERIQFDRVLTHLVPAARQVNGTISGLVLREQAGDLVKKLITDLESRPAIPADAADLAWSACMDDDKFTGLASDQILEVIRRTLKAVTPAPVSGSDTTTDGGDR